MGKKLAICLWFLFGLAIFDHSAHAWLVPDTGQTECYDVQGRTINCAEPGQRFAGQDGSYTINPPSYTKLDATGNALPENASSWVMIKDNVTGLVWEKKTNKDGATNYVDPHDADNLYAWYDSDPTTNGGEAGGWNDGRNTEVVIADLNSTKFGGFNDWRIPTRHELRTIVMYGPRSPGPAINTDYFPNTVWDDNDRPYWSSDSYAGNHRYAWCIDFEEGNGVTEQKVYTSYYTYYVRAVRGGNN